MLSGIKFFQTFKKYVNIVVEEIGIGSIK